MHNGVMKELAVQQHLAGVAAKPTNARTMQRHVLCVVCHVQVAFKTQLKCMSLTGQRATNAGHM